MIIDFLTDKFSKNREREAIVWRDKTYSYGWMEDVVTEWSGRLESEAVPKNNVVSPELIFLPMLWR